MPTVSIVTPLHNKGPFILETVRSVQNQSLADWEMLIVENGSTDNGPEQVGSLRDDRVRLLVSPKRGPGAARNHGLASARGEWVIFLDADDLLEPDYLENRLNSAGGCSQATVVAGPWVEFKGPPSEPGEVRRPTGFGGRLEDVLRQAIGFAPWAVHAALVRRTWAMQGRTWIEEMDARASEDTAFWFRLLQDAEVRWCRATGARYRVATPASRNSLSLADTDRWFEVVRCCVERNLKTLEDLKKAPSPGQCETLMRVFEAEFRRSVAAGNQDTARRALELAKEWLTRCETASISVAFRKALGIRFSSMLARRAAGLRKRFSREGRRLSLAAMRGISEDNAVIGKPRGAR